MSPHRNEPQGRVGLRTIAMPRDANVNGDIFGGWLMAQMDLAGAYHAMHLAEGRVATVGVEAMSFHRPVFVGDEVSCYCRTVRTGHTSIIVEVKTWVQRRDEEVTIQVTEGLFAYVAIDSEGSKRSLPTNIARKMAPPGNTSP